MADDELVWRTSSYSNSGNCVEVAFADESVWIRDSFDGNGQKLAIPVGNWTRFLDQVLRSR
ncbi:DUF397 domain-containing protein [Nocardia sp. NRRL S-836]|uniref:DUF397 domain-containing protein n=1 Tax=Nocardia sp. NRRL S-836 TaxID=1519492 RepID=UPI0012F7FB20|nr:DUF397 domain-containing protein [Nocardia sp. NRRL S-836]